MTDGNRRPRTAGKHVNALSRRWALYRDGETPHTLVETFTVASWEEHLRQHHDRLTGADRDFDSKARDVSDPPAQTSHLIAADG